MPFETSITFRSEESARAFALGFSLARNADSAEVCIDPEEPITILLDIDDERSTDFEEYVALVHKFRFEERVPEPDDADIMAEIEDRYADTV